MEGKKAGEWAPNRVIQWAKVLARLLQCPTVRSPGDEAIDRISEIAFVMFLVSDKSLEIPVRIFTISGESDSMSMSILLFLLSSTLQVSPSKIAMASRALIGNFLLIRLKPTQIMDPWELRATQPIPPYLSGFEPRSVQIDLLVLWLRIFPPGSVRSDFDTFWALD